MTAKRGSKAADPAHPRTGERRSNRGKEKADHRPAPASERRIDESVEESFPASDPPAHGIDIDRDLYQTHAKDSKPVEGERDPDDDEGGIGGEVRHPGHEGEDVDPLERGED